MAQAVEYVLLWLVLSVCAYCSYTDLRSHVVPNRCTYGLLAVGLAGQIALVALGSTDVAAVAARLVVGLVVAGALYGDGIWGPGDAKLYWAMVVALPPVVLGRPSLASLRGPLPAWQ
ncbi:MAG: A24 family peptidase [Candidatus Latescibacterota bacterium]